MSIHMNMLPSGRPSEKEIEDFMHAAGRGYDQGILNFLEKHGNTYVDVKRHSVGKSALHEAAYWGCITTVELLLNKGASIEGRTETGATALICAARGGCKSIVDLLLTRGANIGACDYEGYTAAMHADVCKKPDIVSLIENWPSEIKRRRDAARQERREAMIEELKKQKPKTVFKKSPRVG